MHILFPNSRLQVHIAQDLELPTAPVDILTHNAALIKVTFAIDDLKFMDILPDT